MLTVTVDVNGTEIGRLRIRRLAPFSSTQKMYKYECLFLEADRNQARECGVEHRHADGWHVLVRKALEALTEVDKVEKEG